MVKAIWNNTTVAESDQTVMVEGNHYFPFDSVRQEYLMPSQTTSICPWKGSANYYCLKVGDQTNEDAAWYYAEPSEAAMQIKGHVAFWRGVEVVEE